MDNNSFKAQLFLLSFRKTNDATGLFSVNAVTVGM